MVDLRAPGCSLRRAVGVGGGVVVGGGLDVRLKELNEKIGVTVGLLYGHSLGSRYWGRNRTVTLRGGLVYHTR